MKRLIYLMVLALAISVSAGRVAASPSAEGIAMLGGSGNSTNSTIAADNTGGAYDLNLTITGNTTAGAGAFGGLVLLVLSLIYR